jgi:hypothetical protein
MASAGSRSTQAPAAAGTRPGGISTVARFGAYPDAVDPVIAFWGAFTPSVDLSARPPAEVAFGDTTSTGQGQRSARYLLCRPGGAGPSVAMPRSRPTRDFTLLHALGFYHIGEALDYSRSESREPEALDTEPASSRPSRRRLLAGLVHRVRVGLASLFRHRRI